MPLPSLLSFSSWSSVFRLYATGAGFALIGIVSTLVISPNASRTVTYVVIGIAVCVAVVTWYAWEVRRASPRERPSRAATIFLTRSPGWSIDSGMALVTVIDSADITRAELLPAKQSPAANQTLSLEHAVP